MQKLAKCSSVDLLRINVMMSRINKRDNQMFHVNTLNLYSTQTQTSFTKTTTTKLNLSKNVIKTNLTQMLLTYESITDETMAATLTPKKTTIVLSTAKETATMKLLRDPRLIKHIMANVTRTEIMNKATNTLIAYLTTMSHKSNRPLAVIIQSTSAANKSSLMNAMLTFVPNKERIKFSAMTNQSLFYMNKADLAHKMLAIIEEKNTERTNYALKLLQSKNELSIASTNKNTTSNQLITHTYTMTNPVAIFLTTTAVNINKELLNHCVMLSVNENHSQTRTIHDRQQATQTLKKLLNDTKRQRVVKLHQNAQRLLHPVLVANPFAPRLSFANERTRTQRDHMKYLSLIRAVALLHQHQRPHKTITHSSQVLTYVKVTLNDIALANRLTHEVLGRSLDDLTPQTRHLLGHMNDLMRTVCATNDVSQADVRFTKRQMREHCG